MGESTQPEPRAPRTSRSGKPAPQENEARAYIVMELHDKAVPHRHQTIVFRRDQILKTQHLIDIAREHGVNIKPYDPENSYR
jgi:hypothetical protein